MPHIALAQIFLRSASRAGFKLVMTQGFSPRAKISFGPELPAGVVALNEPVDMYFAENYTDVIAGLNASMPEGFCVSRVLFPEESSPNLGKYCKHAEYFLRSVKVPELAEMAGEFYGASVFRCEESDGWLRLILAEPSQNPIGGLIRHMVKEGVLSGWHEVNIVRVSVGTYDDAEGKVIIHA